ncbi:NUDIX domain-containing protein [Catellatospora tritici]|uniref:NUDIX domain-containing protein n=1 Tax=Catellatospora tritici TaxID=2851566 RepID=UPI001C2D91FC|nr:NUDIX hydrolase [Catellatospora tritici]MBV1849433.1 NUDIX hydrolase [Catellatospora tritici]MBV1854005.1 NUDIX hydrolase [Catellatospora tritici]
MVAVPDRDRVSALLLDGPELILLRRTRPELDQPYWVTPGGGRDKHDASLMAALLRELDEELRAVVTPPVPLTFRDSPSPDGRLIRHHLYACRLVSMDPANRYGTEFANPAKGTYDVDRVPFTLSALAALNLQPEVLRAYLAEGVDRVGQAAQHGRAAYRLCFAPDASPERLRAALAEAYGVEDVSIGSAEESAGPPPRVVLRLEPAAVVLVAGDALARVTGASELELATRLCRLADTSALVDEGPGRRWSVAPDGSYAPAHT